MLGFFKRDLFLQASNAGFYLIFLAAMSVMTFFAEMNASFLFLYAMIFSASALAGLFAYDEANNWQGYAAAAPNGRKAQVMGRYALSLALGVAVAVIMLAATLLGKAPGNWPIALVCAGMLLIYVDVMFPLSYRFGTKSRLVMIIILAVIAGAMGIGGSILAMSGGPMKEMSSLGGVTIVLVGVGLVGMAVSYAISVAIMKRKEF